MPQPVRTWSPLSKCRREHDRASREAPIGGCGDGSDHVPAVLICPTGPPTLPGLLLHRRPAMALDTTTPAPIGNVGQVQR